MQKSAPLPLREALLTPNPNQVQHANHILASTHQNTHPKRHSRSRNRRPNKLLPPERRHLRRLDNLRSPPGMRQPNKPLLLAGSQCSHPTLDKVPRRLYSHSRLGFLERSADERDSDPLGTKHCL